MTQSMPASMPPVESPPTSLETFTSTSLAPGATPRGPMSEPPRPSAVEATWVPCPSRSSGFIRSPLEVVSIMQPQVES